jgi:hypothetical protein
MILMWFLKILTYSGLGMIVHFAGIYEYKVLQLGLS